MIRCISPLGLCPPIMAPIAQFTQLKADGEVRWAVLNVAAILRQYEALHDRLAAAMDHGASVGELISMIDSEVALKGTDFNGTTSSGTGISC